MPDYKEDLSFAHLSLRGGAVLAGGALLALADPDHGAADLADLGDLGAALPDDAPDHVVGDRHLGAARPT